MNVCLTVCIQGMYTPAGIINFFNAECAFSTSFFSIYWKKSDSGKLCFTVFTSVMASNFSHDHFQLHLHPASCCTISASFSDISHHYPRAGSGRAFDRAFLFLFVSLVYRPNLRRNLCHKQKYYRPLLHRSSQCRGTLRSLWKLVRWLVNPSVFRC